MTTRRFRRVAAVAAVVLLALGAGLYGTARLRGNREAALCPLSRPLLARLAPLSRGEVAAFEVAGEARPAPALVFQGPDGSPQTLASLRGRTVLLNLWATWCEPCKREMPALDRLQGELGGPGFEVAAVNIDTRNVERSHQWLREAGIAHLAFRSDPQAKIFQDLRRAGEAEGLPTSLLIGPDGCGLGRISGPAEWASPDAMALARAAILAASGS